VSDPTPFDAGNRLLDEVPAELTTTIMNGPGGQRLAVTVRTPSTTVTVLLAKDWAERWRDQIASAIASMSGLILPLNGDPHG
jgi:hypothetical protein